MDDDALHALDDAIHNFRIATQRPAYARRILDGLGFAGGVASLRVLRAVERLDDDRGPSIRLVATELGVEHSTASRLVDGLVKGGLLVKTVCGEDKRQARLGLTERGRSILREATDRRRQVLLEVTESWPEQDVASLARLLQRLHTGFDERFVRS